MEGFFRPDRLPVGARSSSSTSETAHGAQGSADVQGKKRAQGPEGRRSDWPEGGSPSRDQSRPRLPLQGFFGSFFGILPRGDRTERGGRDDEQRSRTAEYSHRSNRVRQVVGRDPDVLVLGAHSALPRTSESPGRDQCPGPLVEARAARGSGVCSPRRDRHAASWRRVFLDGKGARGRQTRRTGVFVSAPDGRFAEFNPPLGKRSHAFDGVPVGSGMTADPSATRGTSYFGGCACRVDSRAIVSVRAGPTSAIKSTECFKFRWLAAIPHKPLRSIATETATTRVRASVVEADARCTRSARPDSPTRSPRPRSSPKMTVQNTVRASRWPTRIWELNETGMLELGARASG